MAMSWCRRSFFRLPSLYKVPRRHGYIILIPEIGEDLADNQKFTQDGLPEFNTFTIEKCIAAICNEAVAFQDNIKNYENSDTKYAKDLFRDVIIPLEHLESRLEFTWGLAQTLYLGNNVLMPTKSYIQLHEKAYQARISKFNSNFIHNAVINAKKNTSSFTDEQICLLKKYEIEGKLNGIDLNKKQKQELHNILQMLAYESSGFKGKNGIAIKLFNHVIHNADVVKKFPIHLLKNMAVDQNEPNCGPWNVTHSPLVYEGFMEYCPNKTLRWNAWQADIKRCSQLGEKSLNTNSELEKIRMYRRFYADLLGFESYGHMKLKTTMAGTIQNVKNLIKDLLERAKIAQDFELEKLEDFAEKHGLNTNLEHCDIAYYKREQKKILYSFDEEEIREYFPLPFVLEGLFDLCSKLFHIQIIERPKVNAWHEDVKYYDVFEVGCSTPIAGFYFDPYARKNEKVIENESGFALNIRKKSKITEIKPLAALIFNFQVPLYGKPSLLSFKELKYLFFKFGGILQNLLSQANYADVSGNSNVEWDVINTPGHVMIHWLYEPQVIKSLSSHYATQETLPSVIIENLDNVRKHMAGYDLCKELYISSLDLDLYSTKDYWRLIVKKLWPQYNSIPLDKNDSHVCSLTKIVTDQSAGIYYSNVWSLMLAADIYSAFSEVKNEEEKVLEIGKRYKETFLTLGGTCPSNETFRRFRGRDPSHKALLQILGLKKSVTCENSK